MQRALAVVVHVAVDVDDFSAREDFVASDRERSRVDRRALRCCRSRCTWMSPGRLHPAERRAQADLERALALSRSHALPPPPTNSQPPPPTKYGTLIGGTLDTGSTVETSQLAGSHSAGVVRSSSDEQVHLSTRLAQRSRDQELGGEVVPPTYETTTASSANAAKVLVQETPSTASSARNPAGMNPLLGGAAALKPFGAVAGMITGDEDTSGEIVVADSDGEEGASETAAFLWTALDPDSPLAQPPRPAFRSRASLPPRWPGPRASASSTTRSPSLFPPTTPSLPRPSTTRPRRPSLVRRRRRAPRRPRQTRSSPRRRQRRPVRLASARRTRSTRWSRLTLPRGRGRR